MNEKDPGYLSGRMVIKYQKPFLSGLICLILE